MRIVGKGTASQARCPSCGTTRLRKRTRPDRIDRLEGSPFNRIQKYFGAQLYHCIRCRYQFYDRRELATVTAPKVERPELVAQAASTKIPEVPAGPPETKSSVQSHIGRTVRVVGAVAAGEDLCLDGIFNGELTAPNHRVIVGPNGRVEASIRARELIIQGHLTGVLQIASKMILHTAAVVTSNIRASTIIIEEGASLRGNVNLAESDEAGIVAEIENLAASIATPDGKKSAASVGTD